MFSEKFENLAKEMPVVNRWRSACRIVAKKVVQDNLALRRKLVGELLKTVRLIGSVRRHLRKVYILYPVSLTFVIHHISVLL